MDADRAEWQPSSKGLVRKGLMTIKMVLLVAFAALMLKAFITSLIYHSTHKQSEPLREKTSELDFEWANHEEIPNSLAREMRAEAEATLERSRKIAAARAARGNAPYEYYESWQIVYDAPYFLSLQGQVRIDSKPMTHKVILWDKKAGRRLDFSEMFTDWPKAYAVIRSAFCEAALRQGYVTCPSFISRTLTLALSDYDWADLTEVRVGVAGDTFKTDAIGNEAVDADIPFAGVREIDFDLPFEAIELLRPAYCDFFPAADTTHGETRCPHVGAMNLR